MKKLLKAPMFISACMIIMMLFSLMLGIVDYVVGFITGIVVGSSIFLILSLQSDNSNDKLV